MTRRIEFDGIVNFRDLGGLPARGGEIRPGRLYRSDSVAYATPQDVARLVGDLRLRTLIDLRGTREVALLGRGLLAEHPLEYVSAPIVDVEYGAELAEHYLAILAERGELLVSLVRRLAAPQALPALFHCEAGCDRTGVLAAVVLALLGVPDEEICLDYALTADAVPAITARVLRISEEYNLPLPEGYASLEWRPEARVMAATLAGVADRWGGVAGWARAHGLTDEELARLRRALVA